MRYLVIASLCFTGVSIVFTLFSVINWYACINPQLEWVQRYPPIFSLYPAIWCFGLGFVTTVISIVIGGTLEDQLNRKNLNQDPEKDLKD